MGATYSVPENNRKAYLDQRSALELDRSSFISTWRELNDYFVPRRGRFFTSDVNKGDRRSRNIINGEPVLAVREFENGMMSHMTSQARQWLNITTQNSADSEAEGAKGWLSDATENILQVLSRSNFYNVMPKTYKDWGVFATALLFAEEDFENVVHFIPLPIGSFMIGVDEKGRVNQVVRDIRMTVRQIVKKFCERKSDGSYDLSNVSKHVKELWEDKKFNMWVDVCHIVCPNEEYDDKSTNSKHRKFASKYFERGCSEKSGSKGDYMDSEDKMLRESGYDNFPVLSLRWGLNGEDSYGTDSPGWQALGDNKQVQLMEKRGMQAIEKMANPPMVASTELEGKASSILPGGVTYVSDPKTGFYPAVKVDPRINELMMKEESIVDRLKRFFYVDLFRMLGNLAKDMTATEVQLRDDERLDALVGALEQANYEFFGPLVDLVWEFMVRQGRIPPPPPSLAGQNLKVEYVSVLAQAQKLKGLGGLERFIRFVTQFVTVTKDESVLDKVNLDQAMDVYADLTSVPAGIVRSDDDVLQIRQGRAQAQAAQAHAEQLAAAAKGAKDLAGANLEQDSALKRLVDGAAPPAQAA